MYHYAFSSTSITTTITFSIFFGYLYFFFFLFGYLYWIILGHSIGIFLPFCTYFINQGNLMVHIQEQVCPQTTEPGERVETVYSCAQLQIKWNRTYLASFLGDSYPPSQMSTTNNLLLSWLALKTTSWDKERGAHCGDLEKSSLGSKSPFALQCKEGEA